MANIDDELKIIEKAERGDDVRSAIASAILKIATDREFKPQTLNVGNSENHRTLTGGPWDKVVVDIDGSGGGTFDLDYYGTIDANGYYDLWNTGWAERFPGHGWNGLHVDVPQHDAQLTVKEITENGVYDPLTEGYDGYSKVVVSVPGAAGSGDLLTVSFYNGTTFLSSTQVPYGGSATYTGETPVGDTPFIGWNPDPSRVLNNMRCQAVFAGGLGGDISDDWVTIAKNCQAGLAPSKYPVGSTKELVYYPWGNTDLALKTQMVLVDYNSGLFKSKKGKVPKTFWFSRFVLPTYLYGPMYSLEKNLTFVPVAAPENPAAAGLYEKAKYGPGVNDPYGYVLTADTTPTGSKQYYSFGHPTITIDPNLMALLAPVYRSMDIIQGRWSGSGTSLVYSRKTIPNPSDADADSKIFPLTIPDFAKLKTLLMGLKKENIPLGGSQVETSLFTALVLNQITGAISIVASSASQKNFELTCSITSTNTYQWRYDDTAEDHVVEWGLENYSTIIKRDDVTESFDGTWQAWNGLTIGQNITVNCAYRFGFCI